MDIIEKIVKSWRLEHILLSSYLFSKFHIFRSFRILLLPIGGAFWLLHRTLNSNDNSVSILELILKRVSSVSNKKVEFMLKDAAGVAVCAFVISLIDSSVGLNLKSVQDDFFSLLKKLPFAQRLLAKEFRKHRNDFERSLKGPARNIEDSLRELPFKGRSAEEILTLVRAQTVKENLRGNAGKLSGSVYFKDDAHHDLLNRVFGEYSLANPLHADVWPSVMKFEAEIIAMTASLVKGGNDQVCGTTTSGGTESIILAIKAHRDFYREKYFIAKPEMIACVTAHAAVDKACDMLGIKLIKVPMQGPGMQISVAAVRHNIGPNTILLYASAPSFPHGSIDPIEQLAQIAHSRDIGLHVDCCLGGFVLPFAKASGLGVPNFDFSVRGVTSMSLDPHKYGFALKGSSVLLYADPALRQAQYFCYPEWTGGLYTTPTIAGSRSGGLIASCWASMVSLGYQGYSDRVTEIVAVTRKIAAGISKISGLKLLGPNDTIIVCFTASCPEVNIYSVSDHLAGKGWGLNTLQGPACVHLCVTHAHINVVDTFLADVNEAVEFVLKHPELSKHGSAAVYGMTSSIPSGPVKDILKIYNDVVLDL